jgi:hypothetical protein
VNGVLHTALLFYARSRVQRWFFALAMISLAARSLFLGVHCSCSRPASSWYFLAEMLSLMPVLGFAIASLMSSGGQFRTISSLRTAYLIPRARAQLAAGLLLAQVLLAALVTLLVITLGPATADTLSWGSPRGTFEYVFGIATLAVVTLQLISGPSRVVSLLAGALSLGLLGELDRLMQREIAGVPTPDILTLAALAAWTAFAAWYANAGPIAPVTAVWRARRARLVPSRAAPAHVTPAAAVDAFLLGHRSLWFACRRQMSFWTLYIAGFGVVMVLRPFMFNHARHVPPLDFSVVPQLTLLATVIISNAIAGNIARHSRTLWLRSGDSRRALFARAERLSWRALALVGAPFLLAAAVAWTFLPHLFTHALYPLAVYLTVAPCGIYSGLLNFTRTGGRPCLFCLLIISQGGIIAAMLQEDAPYLPAGGVPLGFWILPLGFALLALVLRRMAGHRWLNIDWLRYRAKRPSTMGMRGAD